MLKQNIKEYELIRNSIEAVRQRLTTHLSFAIGGSGILYLAIKSFEKNDKGQIEIALICAFSATLISAFFYLALYKFNSINRYLGYCKLINLEIMAGAVKVTSSTKEIPNFPEHFITWEICQSKLSNSKPIKDLDSDYWTKTLKFNLDGVSEGEKPGLLKNKFNSYNLLAPSMDKLSVIKGIALLFRGINKKDGSRSWRYPLYSSYIYYVLILFFFLLSVLYTFNYCRCEVDSFRTFMRMLKVKPEIFIIFILAVANIKVLIRSFSDLYKLMKGSRTISAYCWKFLAYRIRMLNKMNIKPTYYVTEKSE